jgi:hypothetical protein
MERRDCVAMPRFDVRVIVAHWEASLVNFAHVLGVLLSSFASFVLARVRNLIMPIDMPECIAWTRLKGDWGEARGNVATRLANCFNKYQLAFIISSDRPFPQLPPEFQAKMLFREYISKPLIMGKYKNCLC